MTLPILTRRALLAGVGTTAAATALGGALAVGVETRPEGMTAEQRRDHHLAEYKRACEELDPMIRDWTDLRPNSTCGGGTVAYRITGRYEGDGIYESGTENVFGNRGRWQVTLCPSDDGERIFEVTCPGERMQLTETRLETFIGRRVV